MLRADIVKLVNAVADHVHHSTADHYGAPNKNIGDAFLLVWKPKGQVGISVVADASLRSYVRMILGMQMCKKLRRIERRPVLQERMPGFVVRLGFGLHYGWAVEGAIGSDLKIDASYLSPHVNMASRLEAATKQYATAILLSDSIFSLLSASVQSLCRQIDRVTVKGSQQPVSLYTYDVPAIRSRGGALDDETELDNLEVGSVWLVCLCLCIRMCVCACVQNCKMAQSYRQGGGRFLDLTLHGRQTDRSTTSLNFPSFLVCLCLKENASRSPPSMGNSKIYPG